MTTAIDNLLRKWELIKSNKKSNGFFKNAKNFVEINKFIEQLQLSNLMTIDEIIKALQKIENISIAQKGTIFPFNEWLDNNRYRVLRDLHVPSSGKLTEFSLSANSGLCRFFINMHGLLLGHYELAKLHTEGQLPVSKIEYTDDQLKETQVFMDLEITTQQDKLPDGNAIKDFRRKGVTIYGATIYPQSNSLERDPAIEQALESFAGGSVENPKSKAGKIFNFSGQFLEAICLQEFSNSIVLKANENVRLERGSVKGHINWSKLNGEPYATVQVKIFSCTYCDDNGQQFLTMSSDGCSLYSLSHEWDLEKTLAQNQLEVTGKTDGNIVPLCEFNLKIKMVTNDFGHYLRVDECRVHINTDELVSTKDIKWENAITLNV
ncbi:hypothetical protein [Legionella clemsonensis]|nr:hypothetical protein [Legionella clemsonensis]